MTVWPPGRVAKRLRLEGAGLPQHHPQSIKKLALELGAKHWHTVTWREGSNAQLRSRFARVRVRAAHQDHQREEVRPSEWLLGPRRLVRHGFQIRAMLLRETTDLLSGMFCA